MTRAHREIVRRKTPVPAVPRHLDAVDDKLIDGAVEEIRSILDRTLAKGMEEVGGYLLATFYGNDLELFHSHAPGKHASLRALATRCDSMDLPVSPAFLSRAIRLAARSRQLPAHARYRRLPPSHRVVLLPVEDLETVEQLAADALARSMTVVKLRERVAKLRAGKDPHRGRPRVPAVVRAVGAIRKRLVNAETGRLAFLRADIDTLDAAQRAALRDALRTTRDLLVRLTRLVGG